MRTTKLKKKGRVNDIIFPSAYFKNTKKEGKRNLEKEEV